MGTAIPKVVPTLRNYLQDCESKSKVQIALQNAALSWLDICQNVLSDPLNTCRRFFFECVPQLVKSKQNLSSIIHAMSIYGTINLILISQYSSSPPIIPHMYARALSVYESLITTTHDKTILSACYNPRL